MRQEVFRMERATCGENGISGLADCSLHIFSGEILGLIPLNSNGLASLLDIMTQNLPLEFGCVFLREKMINNWHAPHPQHNPVGLIQRKSRLVEGMTLTDNVFVLRSGFRSWFIRSGLLRSQLLPFFEQIGVDIPLDAYPEDLSFFERVIVELIRAVVAGYKLIVLYDVSTLLSREELDTLYRILREYSREGLSFLYIDTQPEDMAQIADRIAFFEDGRILKTAGNKEQMWEILESLEAEKETARPSGLPETENRPVFRAQKLSFIGEKAVNFSVCRGECVVLEDANSLITAPLTEYFSGERAPASGQIWLNDRPFSPAGSRDVAFIQEQPSRTMIFQRLNYFDNLFITSDHHIPNLWRNRRMQLRLAREYGGRNGTELFDCPVESLSEAEKYDLVYNRILLQKPAVVICNHPFSGADMELKAHIRRLLARMKQKKIALILVVADATDAKGISDEVIRILSAAKNT